MLDLGRQPLSNSYVTPGAEASELIYPLCARLCETCGLVQLEQVVAAGEIFSDYAYFSSYSDSWVAHARAFADEAIDRFELDADSLVLEVASNDGYLLQHFAARGVGVLGIEPAANVAAVAEEKGLDTLVAFFGSQLADQLASNGQQADLVVANNVLAHVPDLNDFVAGLERVLAPDGVITVEVPHLLRLVEETQFDTIYHEHFSYFSLLAAERAFERHGLEVFDVDQLPTHGGSLRIYARRAGAAGPTSAEVGELVRKEREAYLDRPLGFAGFADRVHSICDGLRDFLNQASEAGESVVAYGAAAKGNTLLNAVGVHAPEVAYVVDRNPHKQGLLLPGSHLEIHDPQRLVADRPAYVLILPWNLRDEIEAQMSVVRSWGGRFVAAVPELRVW